MGAKKLKPDCKKSKKSKSALPDIEWNRFMQTVEEIKKETDRKLEEISTICQNRECNAKQR